MKEILMLLILSSVLPFGEGRAQTHENFDIVRFIPPQSWVREPGNGFVSFTSIDRTESQYARILLYASLPSSGNLDKDFDTEWNQLVKPHYQPGDFTDRSVSPFKNGYTAKIGVAPFKYTNQNQVVVLATLSDGQTKISYVFLTNTQRYEKELEDFGSSLNFGSETSPLSDVGVKHQTNMNKVPNQNNAPAISQASTPAGSFAFQTTNFDDGWTGAQEAKWVTLSKGNVQVLLHYGLDFDDAMRTNPVEICWNLLAPNRYNIKERYNFNYSVLDFSYYYMEADVVEKASGQSQYVAFRIVPRNGVAHCIEIKSPDKATFTSLFPNQESIENMLNYNRFAIHSGDLTGTWNSSASSAIMLYNVYTGGNAGMNYASINDEFTFNSGGTYKSRHVGASSIYGNASHFDDQFSGNHIVTNWDITLTNRRDGRSDSYQVFFEAVQGGRILHLTNKQFSGLTFKLFKVK
jgi:hypothetical protein